LPRDPGVESDLKEREASLIESSSREGIDSHDMVLDDMIDSLPFSLPARSSSISSGELSKKSSGLFPNDILRSFSEMSFVSSIESTVSRSPAPVLLRTLLLSLCGGIEVIASNAATAGGIASGEWIVWLSARVEDLLTFCRRPVLDLRVGVCAESRAPRKGIMTGDEGVVGLEFGGVMAIGMSW
jgi:hypothetical protein